MKIETENRDDHQVIVNAELDASKMEGARRIAARKISQQMKIPGFRPGKAPYDVVLRNVGEATITEDAIELLVDEIYPQVLEEAEIKPAAPGVLDEVVSLDPPKFKFLIPLAPTVDLGDYQSIKLSYEWSPPGDDKVDEAIEELRRMHSATETVDRPVESGDFIMIDLKGLEGEKTLVDKSGHPVFINPEPKEDEWPFAGFSNKLIGLSVDQEKEISKKFPKNFHNEEFAGKNLLFQVKIKTVRGLILPELDEDFARKVGNFEDIKTMREVIQSNLSNQSKAEYDDTFFESLLSMILDQSTLKYPPQVLEHEKEHVVNDLKRRLAEQNLELDVYLKMRETDRDKFMEEEIIPVAVKRLERGLIMEKISEVEQIEVSEENLNAAFQQTLFEVQRDDQFQKLVKKNKPSQELMESLARESANRAMVAQTLERLKGIATGVYPDTSEDNIKKESAMDSKKKEQVNNESLVGEKAGNENEPEESAGE